MGEAIRRLREKSGYSQAEVSAFIGVSRQTYIKYEAGEIEPPIRILRMLRRLFNVSYEELIDGRGSDGFSVAENTPVYGASGSGNESSFEKQFNALPLQLRKVVTELMDSLSLIDSAKEEKPVHMYRTPGGLTGEFWMSDDFDETPECFSDYM